MTDALEGFFGAQTALPVAFSPEGTELLIIARGRGGTRLDRVSLEDGDVRSVPAEGVVVAQYVSAGGRLLLEVELSDGRSELVLAGEDGHPVGRVAPDPDASYRLGAVSHDGTAIGFARLGSGSTNVSVHVCDLASGEVRCVLAREGRWRPTSFSPDGRFLAVERVTERRTETELLIIEVETGEVRAVSGSREPAFYGPPAWLPDASGFFLATDAGAEFHGIARYDTGSGSWNFVLELDWDLQCAVDLQGTRLAVSVNENGCSRLLLFDVQTLKRTGEIPLPAIGQAGLATFSPDGRYLAYHFTGDTEPGDAWLYDVTDGSNRRLTGTGQATVGLVFSESHHVRSFDGLWIHLLLYRPRSAEPAPVVVLCHDGPDAQFVPAYHPLVQYLVARGYAVVAPNYRGSTGYGKRFHHSDDNRLRLHPLGDLAYVREWIRETDGLDGERCFALGSGYGGYLALSAAAFYPELWRAVVAFSPIIDLASFVATSPPSERVHREREFGLLERYRELLEQSSPVARVEEFSTPVFIAHGESDSDVPMSDVQSFVNNLDAANVRTELHVYPGAGRRLVGSDRLHAYEHAVHFLDRITWPTGAHEPGGEQAWTAVEPLSR